MISTTCIALNFKFSNLLDHYHLIVYHVNVCNAV